MSTMESIKVIFLDKIIPNKLINVQQETTYNTWTTDLPDNDIQK